MAATTATPNTLLGTWQPAEGSARTLYSIAAVVLGTVLLAISARINIPFIPVPATFQTFAVAVLAAAMGSRLATATVALYIVEGLAGLPVFASGGGLGYVFSPTFGFIISWLPMAYIIGRGAEMGASRSLVALFALMVLADAMVFIVGYLWLLAMSGGATWIDQSNVLGSAFNAAVRPFIVWDLLKMALAAVTVVGAMALVQGRGKSA